MKVNRFNRREFYVEVSLLQRFQLERLMVQLPLILTMLYSYLTNHGVIDRKNTSNIRKTPITKIEGGKIKSGFSSKNI